MSRRACCVFVNVGDGCADFLVQPHEEGVNDVDEVIGLWFRPGQGLAWQQRIAVLNSNESQFI